jgi:dynactin complex subunit
MAPPEKDVRKHALTIGGAILAATMIGGAITVGAQTITRVSDLARREVGEHERRAVAIAHSGVDKLFVSKTELGDKLQQIVLKLDRLSSQLETLKSVMEVRNERNRSMVPE